MGRELGILACGVEGRLTEGTCQGTCMDCTGMSWKSWCMCYDGGICDTGILCKFMLEAHATEKKNVI